MTIFEMLLQGLLHSLTPVNILAATVGVLLGTLAGVLPGIGISGTIALLLPLSYGMDPLTAVILVGGIYYGSQYGGSTTSILLNIPGEPTSLITCMEGHAMAKKGRAGAALGIAAIGSFIGGTLGIIALTFFAPPLADLAVRFGSPEYFALALLGLVTLANVTGGSPLKSGLMVMVGIMLGTVGFDPVFAAKRFTFGITDLERGIDFIVFAMGAFGIAEVLLTVSEGWTAKEIAKVKFREVYPNRQELKRSKGSIFRGSVLGFLISLIPGPSTFLATLASYVVEKKVSKYKDEFGKGAIEGVAGPETANNAGIYAQLVPALALGIPFSPAFALLLSALMIHGVTPGPLMMKLHPDVFWGLIGSMYVANVLLLIFNLPLIPLWASMLKVRAEFLMAIITVVTYVGAFALNNSIFDLWLLVIFGILGYLMKLANYDAAPVTVGLFLGPLVERCLVQSMVMFNGNFMLIFTRPFAGTMIIIAILICLVRIVVWAIRRIRSSRENSTTNPADTVTLS
ncbi:Protein of unknown function DUF112,transmembrane [Moorella glycerini]|uniref:Tripartite tricarboxylate transporter TctA family protein n=1 Tax=Neomoorella stamsii TaxID=1266720 RepID=A0A9X7J4K9_9FIRM|nr:MULTISPECIES: tripartite tricarboxylate transporter permease [Moorella]PRR74823.1 Tripartite tricarboxylate transporter TctA family protein [Moorella stamsii]CEP67991.1 Protein of unknown function DUF112,transmembrane [Moorella glycerini]